MMHANRVPGDNVPISDRPVGGCPCGQRLTGLARCRMVTGGTAFPVTLRRHRRVVINEAGPPTRVIVFR